MEEPTDPSDWSFRPLKDLDNLLRCPICFEYFNTAMMMPGCSHNYCSLCVRRFLAIRPQCPTCSAPASDSQLRNNRILDEMVQQFTKDRKEFMGLVRAGRLLIKGKNGLVSPTEAARHKDRNVHVSLLQSKSVAVPTKQIWEEKVMVSESPGSNAGGCVPEPPSSQMVEEAMQILAEGGGGGGGKRNKLVSSQADCGKQWVDVRGPHTSSSYHGGLRVDASAPSSERKETSVPVDHTTACKPAVIGMETEQLESVHKPSASLKRPGFSPSPSVSQVSSLHSSSISFSSPRTPKTPRGGKGSKRTAKGSSIINFPRTPSRNIKVEPTASPSPSASKPEPKVNLVTCPSCSCKVREQLINSHLDLCLSKPPTPSASGQPLPRLPKLCWNIMADKQLRKKLKEYHLSTNGNRPTMIVRLQEFTLQYTAQGDSLNPMSVQQIAREVEKAEKARFTKKPQIAIRKDSTTEEIEQEKKAYEQTHKEHFAQLVENARMCRQQKRKASEKGPGEGSVWTPPNKGQAVVTTAAETDTPGIEVLVVETSDSSEGENTAPSPHTKTTTIPESPTGTSKLSTPRSRPKRKCASSLLLSSDSDDERRRCMVEEDDPDFLPSTPFRRKKQRRT